MNYKQLYDKVQTMYNSMSNALEHTPGAVEMSCQIKDIPLEVLQDYAQKQGEIINPVRLDGTVSCCLTKITEHGVASINLVSERHKITLEKF